MLTTMLNHHGEWNV